MKIVLICLFVCSCCPKPEDNNNLLPRYSDMGAAEDAGKAK